MQARHKHLQDRADKTERSHNAFMAVKDEIGVTKAILKQQFAEKDQIRIAWLADKAEEDAAKLRAQLSPELVDTQPVPRFEVGRGVNLSAFIPKSAHSGLRELGDKNGTNISEETRCAVNDHLARAGLLYAA